MSQHTLPKRPGGKPTSIPSFRRQGSLESKGRDSQTSNRPSPRGSSYGNSRGIDLSPSPPSHSLTMTTASSFKKRMSPRTAGDLSPNIQHLGPDLRLSPRTSPRNSPKRVTSRKALKGPKASTHADQCTKIPHLPPLLGEIVNSESDPSSSDDEVENPLALHKRSRNGKVDGGVRARKISAGISSDDNSTDGERPNTTESSTASKLKKRRSGKKIHRSDSLDAQITRELRDNPVIQQANELKRKLVEEHKRGQSKDKEGNWIDWVARNRTALGGGAKVGSEIGVHGRIGRTSSHKVRRTSSLSGKGATVEEILGPPLFEGKGRKLAQSPEPSVSSGVFKRQSSNTTKSRNSDGLPPTHGGRLRWLPSVDSSLGEGTPGTSAVVTPTSGTSPKACDLRTEGTTERKGAGQKQLSHAELVHANRIRQQDKEIAEREEAIRSRAQQKDPETIRMKRWKEMVVHALSFPVLFNRCLKAQAQERKEAHAREVLRLVFLPAWRFYKHRLRASAESAICKALYRRAASRRIRNRGSAADTIQQFLRTKHLYFSYVVRWFVLQVKKAQRIAKKHLEMRAAQIELNLRRCRKFEKEEYWIEAKQRRDSLELAAVEKIKTDFAEEFTFVDSWDTGFHRWREIEMLEQTNLHRSSMRTPTKTNDDNEETGVVRVIPKMFLQRRIRTLINSKAKERRQELSSLRREHEYEIMLKSHSQRPSPRNSPTRTTTTETFSNAEDRSTSLPSTLSRPHLRSNIVGAAIRRTGSFARSGSFKGSLPASMRGGSDSKLLPQQPWNLVFDTSECRSVLDQAARTTESMRDDVTWSIHTFKVDHLVVRRK